VFIFRLIKRVLKFALIVVLIAIAIPVVGLIYGFATTPPLEPAQATDAAADNPPSQALADQLRTEIPGYQRTEESTFLTYPEWAIVYAAREYAGFVKDHRESGFPYWSYIGRFWQDYAMVIRASSGYPFNFANHQMLAVIGTSHTVEHAIQWAYENSIGRITEWLSGYPVAVDRYQAGVAADYAAFLDQVPWYQFPYAGKRAGLMATEPAAGDSAARTFERKGQGWLAYSIKQGYADLIKAGLAATSDPAFLDIHVWATGDTPGAVAAAIIGEADTDIEKDLGAEGAVFVTKRYQVFTEMIPRLIAKGIRFRQIGGNDEILVSLIADREIAMPAGARALFDYPLPADPAVRRIGLIAPVSQLHAILHALATSGARLEHIYDY
jgi:hypothetical protein